MQKTIPHKGIHRISNKPLIASSNGYKIISSKKFATISLFTGIGGLDLGFEGGFTYKNMRQKKLPFKVSAAYEIDPKCVETLRQNLVIPIHEKALSLQNAASLPKGDVLIGGFPCQDFSSCGPKKGLSSTRGKLYKVLVKYMEARQPMVVCAENVPHLARMKNGEILKTILDDFSSVGYKVELWNLYAPDFGVPQSRRRLFFICVRDDLKGFPSVPKPNYAGKHRSTSWAISDLEEVTDESVPNQSQYFKASKAKRGNGQGDEKSPADMPSYTVRANAKSRVQFHYKLNRRLTVRECARLQTFPDYFRLPHSATANIMQIGNAVPPLLAYKVAKQIANFLNTQKS